MPTRPASPGNLDPVNAATRTSRFPALQFPDYRRFLLGSFISNVGNMAQTVAVALHVYTLTGDSFLVGMLGLVRVVPLLLFSLFGGLVADHSDRRKVLLLTQGLMALVAAGFLAIELAGITQLWMIYALIALFSVARAFDGPSRMAMVPNLVDVHALPNAIGLNGMSWRLSDVLGPLIVSAVAFTGGIPAAGGGIRHVLRVQFADVHCGVLGALEDAASPAGGAARGSPKELPRGDL